MTCLHCNAKTTQHALFCSNVCALRHRLGARPAIHWCEVCHAWVSGAPLWHAQTTRHRAATFLYARHIIYNKALVYE